jgi:hypothetical protein
MPQQDVLCNNEAVCPPVAQPIVVNPETLKAKGSKRQKAGHHYYKKVVQLTNGFFSMNLRRVEDRKREEKIGTELPRTPERMKGHHLVESIETTRVPNFDASPLA